MNEALKILPAVPGDAMGILACVTAAYSHYIERMGKSPGPMLDDYEQVIARQHVSVIKDPEVVGVVVLVEQADGILLDNIAVDPAQQGRGIGRKLMAFAEAEAQRLGYAQLELYTHELMTENIVMYEKMGYAEIERRVEKGYQRVYMRKELSHT